MDKSPIVARINDLLALKGTTKAQFFADCGITSGGYSQWNTGKTKPSVKKLKAVADYLGTTYEYLLTGEGQKEKPTPISESELDNELIKMLVQLTPDEAEKVAAFAAGLIAARTV